MEASPAFSVSLCTAILVPFGTPDFGPKLATGLLVLAVAVFLCFLCFALPQLYRLRSALLTVNGNSDKESAHEQRSALQENYDAIDSALVSNRATSSVWQEFRKTLIFRNGPRSVILASSRPGNFFNPRSLLVQYDFVR